MSNQASIDSQVEEYEAALRLATRDLPEHEVEDLIGDMRSHLAEVVAEHPSVALTEQVGTPDEYVSELRTAAGYGPPPATRRFKPPN